MTTLLISINIGHVTGGSLKTLDQADKESLQAQWLPADPDHLPERVPLRAPDILPLIEIGKKWQERKPFSGLPVNVGHVSVSVRLVVVYCTSDADEGQVSVLVKESSLPVCVCDKMVRDPIRAALTVCFCKNGSIYNVIVMVIVVTFRLCTL